MQCYYANHLHPRFTKPYFQEVNRVHRLMSDSLVSIDYYAQHLVAIFVMSILNRRYEKETSTLTCTVPTFSISFPSCYLQRRTIAFSETLKGVLVAHTMNYRTSQLPTIWQCLTLAMDDMTIYEFLLCAFCS